ncbi:MAG TPA: alanine--glyoxylate aminotransferase family protein [Gemmatimonadota bacterium]|nr:alanine--glyoxylate aminotransferase family protein [Gemmatimonadota bacterium]
MIGFGKYFLPGPTEVRPEVLQAMNRPVIGHRGAEMEALMERIQPRLRMLFRTRRPVYVSTSSATGLMEAAIRNCVPRRVLSLVCGAFSERFYEIAVACGREAQRIDVEPGSSNEPDSVADALSDGDFDAVTVVHSETSTGVLNPVGEIARTVREVSPDTLVLVDCVTSLAAAPVETQEWGLDFALTGSQKGMALPPGLAFGAASQRAFDRSRDVRERGIYFSFEAFESAVAKNQTPNTPASSIIFALDVQLQRIEAEGLEARWARHAVMAERTWGWVDEMRDHHDIPLSVLASAGRRSPSVTCVKLPDGLSGVAITRAMAERGFTIASGYGALRDKTFRIGHMGDHTVDELEVLLQNLEDVIRGSGT